MAERTHVGSVQILFTSMRDPIFIRDMFPTPPDPKQLPSGVSFQEPFRVKFVARERNSVKRRNGYRYLLFDHEENHRQHIGMGIRGAMRGEGVHADEPNPAGKVSSKHFV